MSDSARRFAHCQLRAEVINFEQGMHCSDINCMGVSNLFCAQSCIKPVERCMQHIVVL